MTTNATPGFWDICRQVYLLWAVILLVGFGFTQFHQLPDINTLWIGLSVVGLGFMGLALIDPSNRVRSLILSGVLWLVTVAFGLVVSVLAFQIDALADLSTLLGVFWLFLLGIGTALNGMADPPQRSYWLMGLLQVLIGALSWMVPAAQTWQYLAAGVGSAAAMAGLILLR